MRFCHHRLDLRKVDIVHFGEFRIRVALIAGQRLPAVRLQVLQSHLVHRHQSGFGPGLHRQVAQDEPVADGQPRQSRSCELHGLIVGAVGAYFSDNRQNHIPSGHAFPQRAGQIEPKGLRHHHPGFARHHGVQVIRAPHAGPESPQTPVGASVAVRPENQLARPNVFFHHHLVANALALVEINSALPGEIPHLLLGLRRLHAVARHVVIHHPHQPGWICNVRILQIVVFINGQMCGTVVTQHVIQSHHVNFTGLRGVHPGCPGDDFLCNRHSHFSLSPCPLLLKIISSRPAVSGATPHPKKRSDRPDPKSSACTAAAWCIRRCFRRWSPCPHPSPVPFHPHLSRSRTDPGTQSPANRC